MTEMIIPRPDGNLYALKDELEKIDGIEEIVINDFNRTMNCTIMGKKTSINSRYGGSFSGYGGIYRKFVQWNDINSVVSGIKRKIKMIVNDEEGEQRRKMIKIERELLEERVIADATERFGGRARCIVGPFGAEDTFSLRLHLTEDDVMEFLEINKDYIDDNGKWKGR